MLDQLKKDYTKPHEQVIIDWLMENGIEDIVLYPQDNPTILITWNTPDPDGKYLFREIEFVVDDEQAFRVSGGAMYHAPTYHLAWFSYRFITVAEIKETLTDLHAQVDKLTFHDLEDMDAYLAVNLLYVGL
ncbi:MAG: hypothetical protein O3A46_11435 [Candidatus Poribacteria bacterium]|nr:hypothetical protein [Candidatus Poribacteria bacterium]